MAFEDDRMVLLDQTRLPGETVFLEIETPEETADAIGRLAVRGAMAIAVAGAYGVLLGAMRAGDDPVGGASAAVDTIGASRPTARNLFWALERMERVVRTSEGCGNDALRKKLRAEADAIAQDTIQTNQRLVRQGQSLIPRGARALTHCNSGPLAALVYGTAVGVLIEAHRLGKDIHVLVDETRPLLQGARLTTWELAAAGVPCTLIPDNTAGWAMANGMVDLVITGADRIAANGDSANKIGTYSIAALAGHHGIPFYVAAPLSTLDLACIAGDSIVIEERSGDEVRRYAGVQVAPKDVPVFNPSFDVTPAKLIKAIVTEEGVCEPPYVESLKVAVERAAGGEREAWK